MGRIDLPVTVIETHPKHTTASEFNVASEFYVPSDFYVASEFSVTLHTQPPNTYPQNPVSPPPKPPPISRTGEQCLLSGEATPHLFPLLLSVSVYLSKQWPLSANGPPSSSTRSWPDIMMFSVNILTPDPTAPNESPGINYY